MPSLDASLSFLGIALVLAYTPGPDNLFVLMQAITRGRAAGMFVVFGLCTGLVVHTAAVALGLAAVFAASATAFTVLKFTGAAYLVYLAWQVLRARPSQALPQSAGNGGQALGQMYMRGIIMNLTNPKVVFFFLALLPQFVRADAGPVAWQLCWFGLLFIFVTLFAFGSITWFAAAIGRRFQQSARAQRLLNIMTALVFVGLAARLALAER